MDSTVTASLVVAQITGRDRRGHTSDVHHCAFHGLSLCARKFRITTDLFGYILERHAGMFRVASLPNGMIYVCVSKQTETS